MPFVSDYRALISGHSWAGMETTGTPVFVTYSFPKTQPDYQQDAFADTGFRPLTASEQADARRALDTWSAVSGIHFLEVDAGAGDITFGVHDFTRMEDMDDTSGFALFPQLEPDTDVARDAGLATTVWNYGGDIFLDAATGTSFSVMLHEIGHAIGLKHPFEAEPGHREILRPSLDTSAHTVMSYTWLSEVLPGLGDLDIAAVRSLYGSQRMDGTQVARWSFDARTDTLTQVGRSGNDAILGISTADQMTGGRGNDSLSGLAGNDTLSGGSGHDILFGGADDDLLLPGTGRDLIDGGDGTDTLSYAGFTRAIMVLVDVEDGNGVTLLGDAVMDTFARIEAVIGGAGDDILVGDDGANVLEGGAGADGLAGGRGLDTASYADAPSRIRANLADPGSNFGVAAGDDYLSIERLAGSAFSDWLTGNAGRNQLSGGAGNDILNGGGGADTLIGGGGADRFVFSLAPGARTVATIRDFEAGHDSLLLDHTAFAAVPDTGRLAATAFRDLATGSVDRTDRILYDSTAGVLLYDADGSGSGHTAIRFAVLAGKPALSAADFLVV